MVDNQCDLRRGMFYPQQPEKQVQPPEKFKKGLQSPLTKDPLNQNLPLPQEKTKQNKTLPNPILIPFGKLAKTTLLRNMSPFPFSDKIRYVGGNI